jgi:hypothetical protein
VLPTLYGMFAALRDLTKRKQPGGVTARATEA